MGPDNAQRAVAVAFPTGTILATFHAIATKIPEDTSSSTTTTVIPLWEMTTAVPPPLSPATICSSESKPVVVVTQIRGT